MYTVNIFVISLMAVLAVGLNIPENESATKHRAACAQIDFDNPTKITYWSAFGGIGPVVGHGINSLEAENMLSTALTYLAAIDDHQYKIDKIISSIKCIMSNNLYEFHANLIGSDAQSKSCVIQIYKNHQQLTEGPVTAVVISCPDEAQYVKTYTEVNY